MERQPSEAEAAVVECTARFADDVVRPAAAEWEAARRQPIEALRAACAAGLGGLVVPAEHGGLGLRPSVMARVMETLAAADMAFAFALVVHNNLAGAIARDASPGQIERYLPGLVRGDRLGAFLLTEPGAGSDAAAIATRAVRDGEGWVLDGEKAWVSNAANADVLSVYAQTDPAAGWRGIACFLVEAEAPGVVREPPYHVMGGHALGTGGFRFEGCRLGAEALFVPAGRGFKAALAGIDLARVMVAAMCCGMMRECLGLARDGTRAKRAFGRPVAEFQGLRWMLADVATDLEAAGLLVGRAAALLDEGADATVAAAHAKKFAARAAHKGIADCMQVLGADGFRHDLPLARHLAAAKMAHYLDGTTEIQNLVIARDLLD